MRQLSSRRAATCGPPLLCSFSDFPDSLPNFPKLANHIIKHFVVLNASLQVYGDQDPTSVYAKLSLSDHFRQVEIDMAPMHEP